MLADRSSSDEADVFLESRSSNTANLDRNALVSSMKLLSPQSSVKTLY